MDTHRSLGAASAPFPAEASDGRVGRLPLCPCPAVSLGPIAASSPARAETPEPISSVFERSSRQTYAGLRGPRARGQTGSWRHRWHPLPVAGQPVEGFSAIIDGHHPASTWRWPTTALAAKAARRTSDPRLQIRPDSRPRTVASARSRSATSSQFRDPAGLIGFPIVNEGTAGRLLTGGDIDPESSSAVATATCGSATSSAPGSCTSTAGQPARAAVRTARRADVAERPVPEWSTATHPNSRGFEAMAITPNRKHLYAALEGATLADPDTSSARVRVSPRRRSRSRSSANRGTRPPRRRHVGLDRHHLAVIERDGGRGHGPVPPGLPGRLRRRRGRLPGEDAGP